MMNIKHIKYPRTFHLPYSLTITDDDKRLSSDEQFINMDEVVVTTKMDGENASVYPDGFIHARSIDGNKHEWQDWLKRYVRTWCFDIPEGWRVCGENLYPRHSIAYHFSDEKDFFQVFGIYNEKNECIAWDEVEQWCEMLGVRHVHVLFRGAYDKDQIIAAFNDFKIKSKDDVEGFVIRNAGSFAFDDFARNVGKYVRANHVQTDEHWTEHWIPNEII